MVLEDITIKLTRFGGGSKPSYSLTLNGNGELIYTGFENVRVKGKIKENLDEDIFLEILSHFKEIDFFSKNDNYIVEKRSGRPYTNISIAIPISEEKLKTSSITHHDDDFNVSLDIIDLEKKIDTLIGSEKWTKVLKNEAEPIKQGKKIIKKEGKNKKKQKIKKKKKDKININLKLIIPVIIILIILTGFIFFIFTNNNPHVNNNSSNNNYSNPEITFLKTTSSSERTDNKRPSSTVSFENGDIVYVDFEAENIIHNKTINIRISFYVSFGTEKYYEKYLILQNYSFNKPFFYKILNFTIDESFIGGRDYNVTIKVEDLISDKKCYDQISFRLKKSNSSTFSPLNAEIIEINQIDDLIVSFEANASGGTGFYAYTWNIYDISGIFIDSVEGQTGTYEFSKSDVYEFELIVDDGENYSEPLYRYITLY